MMGTIKLAGIVGLAAALAGCGGETSQQPAVEEAPATLAAGIYELTAEVTDLSSTDKTTPATALKKGDKVTVKACVAANAPDPALLAEAGDKCEIKNSYIRNGRMSAQMSCTRAGHDGYVMPAMMGKFTKDGFDGEINTLTYFVKDGDYRMTRKISAKRVGECPMGAASTD
jgi:hypothetical protein